MHFRSGKEVPDEKNRNRTGSPTPREKIPVQLPVQPPDHQCLSGSAAVCRPVVYPVRAAGTYAPYLSGITNYQHTGYHLADPQAG